MMTSVRKISSAVLTTDRSDGTLQPDRTILRRCFPPKVALDYAPTESSPTYKNLIVAFRQMTGPTPQHGIDFRCIHLGFASTG